MEAPLENNIEASQHSQQDSQSSLPKEYPQFTPQQLFQRSMDLFKKYLVNAPYDAFKIKNTVRKLFKFSSPKFTKQHLDQIVAKIQLFYRENKHVSNLMTVVRYYHQLLVQIDRLIPLISNCLPEVYMEAFGIVYSDEKLKYYLIQLKALYRIWLGYLDARVIRKIRDYITVSYPDVNLLDLELTNPTIQREIMAINISKGTVQRIMVGDLGYNRNPYQRGRFQPRRANSRRGRYQRRNPRRQQISLPPKIDKDEQESNNTNVFSEKKEQEDQSLSSQGQSEIKGSQQKSIDKKQESIKTCNQNPEALKVQKLINNQEKTVDLNQNKAKKQEESCNNDKAAKLKEMYTKLMLQKKKKGKKILNSPESWQFSQNIFQVLKQKVAIQQINYLFEQSDEEDDWNYPDMSPTDQIVSSQVKQYNCQFCSSNIEQLNEKGKEYLKNAVCFDVAEVKNKKRPAWVPSFRYEGPSLTQGMHFLHKECFEAIVKGIDEKKWNLQ